MDRENSNVIHMAIRPAEAGDDDMTQRSAKGGGGGGGGGAFGQSSRGDREHSSASAGCRCVIL